jgi:DNA replication protein DnaC
MRIDQVFKKGAPNGVFVRLNKEHSVDTGLKLLSLVKDLEHDEPLPCGRRRKFVEEFTDEEWEALTEPHRMIMRASERGRKGIEEMDKRENERISRMVPYHMVGSYSNLKTHDFNTCQLSELTREHRPYLKKALEKVEAWDPDNEKKGFFFYGRPGSGKTRLLKGLGLKWALRGKTVQFHTLWGLMSAFKQFDLGSAHLEHFKRQLVQADLLVLDDFGTEGTTEFVDGELLRLIDERTGRPGTLHISSNISPTQVAGMYGERITDRLKQLVHSMEMNDSSYRPEVNKDNADFWDD